MTQRRPRGSGSLYMRGKTWWLRFTHPVTGAEIRRSAGTRFKREAEDILRAALAEARTGVSDPFAARQTTLRDLIDLQRGEYRDQRYATAEGALKFEHARLVEFFGERCPVTSITSPRLRAYQEWRRAQTAQLTKKPISDKTIYLELSALRAMMRLGAAQTPPLVQQVPKFPGYRQRPTMEDRYLDHEVEAIVANLPAHLRGFVLFFRYTGRRPGEFRALAREQVDVEQGLIEIRSTKTGQMFWADVSSYAPLMEVLRAQAAYTAARAAHHEGREFPWFFHKPGGQPIGSIQRSWIKASESARVERRRFYALRASAIYDMAMAGIEETLVRDLVGQKTLKAYEHYFRNTRERQQHAFGKLSAHHENQRKNSKVVGIRNGTASGTTAAKTTPRKKAAK